MSIKAKEKNRILYLDYLRIISMVGVIIGHVVMQKWFDINVNSFEWTNLTIIDTFVRPVVPIFIMISGVLFLDNDKPLDIKNYISIIF